MAECPLSPKYASASTDVLFLLTFSAELWKKIVFDLIHVRNILP